MSVLGRINSSLKSIKNQTLSSLKASLNPTQVLNNALNQTLDQISIPRVPLDDLRPGDISILRIGLTDVYGAKVTDLMPFVASIDIYESMESPVMYATLTIRDAAGQEEAFRYTGHEMIQIELAMPGDRNNSFKFEMHCMGEPYNRNVSNNNKQVTYNWDFCSTEAYTNAAAGWVGWMPYEDNIKNVVSKLFKENISPKSNKKIFIDDTKGIDKGDIRIKHSFEAINYLRHMAWSKKYASHAYVFFENKRGFQFREVERLMENGRKEIDNDSSDKIFYFDVARNEDIGQVKLRNILAYNRLSGNDVGEKLAHGTDPIAVGVNTVTGDYTVVQQSSSELSSKTQRSDTNGADADSGDLAATYGSKSPTRKLAVVNDEYKNHEELLNKMTATQVYAMKLTEQICWIEIYGDLEISAGDVICIEMASNMPENFKNGDNKKDSGNYLVWAVRHMIINNERPAHIMAMQILKVGSREK